MNKTISINISLEEEFAKKAKKYAKKTGRTFSGIIKISIEKLIEEENKEVLA